MRERRAGGKDYLTEEYCHLTGIEYTVGEDGAIWERGSLTEGYPIQGLFACESSDDIDQEQTKKKVVCL